MNGFSRKNAKGAARLRKGNRKKYYGAHCAQRSLGGAQRAHSVL